MNIRFKIYAVLFSAFVTLDAYRSLEMGKTGVINWHSSVHSGWVVLAAILLLAAAFLKYEFLRYAGLAVYFIIFMLSLINQLYPFNPILNYYCMLFNLGLFNVYFFGIKVNQIK